MPGLGLDLNLDPDLQAACRRLSYRGAYSPSSPKGPPLPTIDESPEKEPPAPPSSPRTTGAPTVGAPAPVATSLALALPAQSHSQRAQDVGTAATKVWGQQRKRSLRNRVSFAEDQRPVPGETTLTPTAGAPAASWLALAPPAQSQSQQAHEAAAAAATRVSEQRRHEEERAAFAEYQRPAMGETLVPTVGAPVGTWFAVAYPAQSQSQQAQEAAAAAATRMSEQRRHEEERASFAVYQQQHQQALAVQAGLQQALAAQQESQQLMLFTVDGRAASYETKWDELHPVSQGLLLQIEDRIMEHRDDSEQLDQCRRFDDLTLCNMSFEFDASQITQESVSISTIMNREKNSIESLMTVIKEIMLNTEFAMNSYVKLRPRFVCLSAESASSGFSNHSGSSGAQTDFHQLLTMTPKFRCYSSATKRPSPFVQQIVARFEDDLGYCCKLILELEQLVQMKNGKTFAEYLESLSNVMSNVYDYLIHVASKVEHFHQYVETVETQYLYGRRCRGDLTNPFLKANKREAAEQEVIGRIIHPMLHLRPPGQPATPVAAPMVASQLQQTSFPTVATNAISYPTVPLPSVLPPSSPQTNPAPSINPFSSSRPFDSFSTLALGSMPATSLFGTIPSTATSLFPVPSGGGIAASGINRVPSMCSLIARGRPPRETIYDLDCGWGSCEEASVHKSATTNHLRLVNASLALL